MNHVGTDHSTCMGGGLPRCDLGHWSGSQSKSRPAHLNGKMIKCEDLEELMVNVATREYVQTSSDLYLASDTGDSVQFGGIHGWKFDGTLYEISVEAMPVETLMPDSTQAGEHEYAKTMDLALASSFLQESPVEMFVAACNVSGVARTRR